ATGRLAGLSVAKLHTTPNPAPPAQKVVCALEGARSESEISPRAVEPQPDADERDSGTGNDLLPGCDRRDGAPGQRRLGRRSTGAEPDLLRHERQCQVPGARCQARWWARRFARRLVKPFSGLALGTWHLAPERSDMSIQSNEDEQGILT